MCETFKVHTEASVISSGCCYRSAVTDQYQHWAHWVKRLLLAFCTVSTRSTVNPPAVAARLNLTGTLGVIDRQFFCSTVSGVTAVNGGHIAVSI